jgi:hypothetical protein
LFLVLLEAAQDGIGDLDLGVEERFGFECHLFSGSLCSAGKKPSPFALGKWGEHPTSKAEKRCTAGEPQESDLDKPG